MLLLFGGPAGGRPRELHRPAPDRRRRTWPSRGSTPSRSGCSCSARSSCSAASWPRWTRRQPAGPATSRCRARLDRRASGSTSGSSAWRSSDSPGMLGARQLHRRRSTRCGRPGMRMFRMPMFTWNDPGDLAPDPLRVPGRSPRRWRCCSSTATSAASFFDPTQGGSADPVAAPVLVLRPPRGLHPHPAVLRRDHRDHPGVLRQPLFGYRGWSSPRSPSRPVDDVWAHHMFTTGAVSLPVLRPPSLAIAVPTGIKFFNWIATMWGGRLALRDADAVGASASSYMFLIGGITGVMLASPPLDFHAPRHLLRRRPLALRADRRLGVRRVRRRSTTGSRR